MDLQQLNYFLAVAELESISAAAERFMISQPSLSRTIARLESELEVKLFDRSRNRITLNANGRLFRQYVQTSLNRLSDGVQHIREDNDRAENHITLVVNVDRDVVIDAMQDFQRLYPEVRFRVYHHIRSEGRLNPFDLCVSSSILEEGDLASSHLSESSIAVAVHEGHPLFGCEGTVPISLLDGEPIAIMRPDGDMGSAILRVFRENSITPDIRLTCNEPHYLRRFVEARMGLAIVMDSYRPYMGRDIRVIRLAEPDMKMETRLYWHRDRYYSPMLIAFRNMLIARFEQAS